MKNKKDIDMKRIIHIAVLIILALPMQAQGTFSLRVRFPKDYPNEIEYCSMTTKFEDRHDESQNLLRNGWDFTIGTKISEIAEGSIQFHEIAHHQDRKSRGWHYELCIIPIIPGEKAIVNILDTMTYEISGSRIYREYGKARKTILLEGENTREYISHHRKEKGCYLYLRSVYNGGDILDDIRQDSLLGLFDKSVQDYFNSESRRNYKPFHTDVGTYNTIKYVKAKWDSKFLTLDRYAEGEALLDTIRERYRGQPTLICIQFDKVSKKDELLIHANGLQVISLLNPGTNGGGSEVSLRNSVAYYPFDHYIVMGYQIQALSDLIKSETSECFLLLDAEGKIIGKAGNRREYRQLLRQLDRIRQEMGQTHPTQPFYKKAPKMRYLDVDPTTDWLELETTKREFSEEELNNILAAREALRRMQITTRTNTNGGLLTSHFSIVPLSPKKLKISKRLYDYLKGKIEEYNVSLDKQRRFYDEIKHRRELGDKEALEPFDTAQFPVGNAIDLGLSVKWADMNVGAKAPEEGGLYYAWGEISPIPDRPVEWSTYKWCNGYQTSLTKYCSKPEYGDHRYVDTLTTLQPCDDVATVRWGSNWRIPTADELQELCDKCTWEWTIVNGQPGNRITGPNGNNIFLPATGMYNHLAYDPSLPGKRGYIWSSTLNPDSPDKTSYLWHHEKNHGLQRGTTERRPGIAVRPVQDK